MTDVLDCKHPVSGNTTLWRFQRHLVNAVFNNRFVAVGSSRGTGKSFAAGRVGLTFFYTRPSKVILLAPSMRQVREVVFGEAKTAWHAARRPLHLQSGNGKPSSLDMRIDERCWMMGLPARDPDAVRGFHARPQVPSNPDDDYLSPEDVAAFEDAALDTSIDVLIVIDEPEGINREIFRVLRGMMTKPNVRCLMIGNPMLGLDDDHDYVRAFRDGSGWHRIRVSSFPEEQFPETQVNYDAVFDSVPAYLVSHEDRQKALRELDPDDPIFLSDWLGRFSPGSTASLVVPRTALLAAVGTKYANIRALGPKIGIDIGTGNPDPCVAVLYVDGVKRAQHVWRPASDDREAQVTIATTIQGLLASWGQQLAAQQPERFDGEPIDASRVSIDDSGLVGVADILASRGLYVDRVNFATSAEGQWRDLVGTQRFLNIRAEMHWVARRGLQEGIFVIPEAFRESWEQATWTRFERAFDSTGPIIKLEPKDEVKKRHGRSPDVFDADILAMRYPREGGMFGSRGPHVIKPGAESMRAAGIQPIVNGRLRPTRLK